MKIETAKQFDMTEEQLIGLYEEMLVLSKKSPDGPTNKFKLKFINELLAKANSLLGDSYHPLKDFDTFDEEELPTSSDVVFILSQYLKVMDKFRYDNTILDFGTRYWKTDDRKNNLQTKHPKYLNND
ncbi:MAG: hypothetical protein IH588_19470 [Anaerolineales bacterium]|nr:hypothetical protein [Anaerolineales bacterium]